jgi:hypothetical protein
VAREFGSEESRQVVKERARVTKTMTGCIKNCAY